MHMDKWSICNEFAISRYGGLLDVLVSGGIF